jgi:hypothetical protein
MTDKEKVSRLSKILEKAEEQVRRCDELDPWGGIETGRAFLTVCSVGGALIAELHQTEQDIINQPQRLKAISQLDLGSLSRVKPRASGKTLKRWSQTWGRALELTADLKDAAKFCAGLAEEKENWFKSRDYRLAFKESSEKLAGYLLYDLLDVLAEYEAEEYPNLRLQVVCSYLKELRVEFIWDTCVRGPCRMATIPSQCKFEGPPDNAIGQLVVSYGGERHEVSFVRDTGDEYKCSVNNTGIKDYRALLDDVWDATTGKLHSFPQDGSAVWAVPGNEGVQNLETYTSLISRLLRPISVLEAYSEYARVIRAVLRRGRNRWRKQSHIKWCYLDDLDKVIAELADKGR